MPTKLTITLPTDLSRRARAVAASRRETVADVVRRRLEEYVAEAQAPDVPQRECEGEPGSLGPAGRSKGAAIEGDHRAPRNSHSPPKHLHASLDAAFEAMSRDKQRQAEVDTITAEFAAADWEALTLAESDR